jgi:hypothetical protein
MDKGSRNDFTSTIPPDDSNRQLTVACPNDAELRHVSVAGGTYTILLSGSETAGRYCLIDMLAPDGGSPSPHRHDFEEMFTLLDGELEFTFRPDANSPRRIDGQHPRQRTARVQELFGQDGPHALPLRAGGTGGAVHGPSASPSTAARRPRRNSALNSRPGRASCLQCCCPNTGPKSCRDEACRRYQT